MKMKCRYRTYVLCLTVVLLCISSLHAQSGTATFGTIYGGAEAPTVEVPVSGTQTISGTFNGGGSGTFSVGTATAASSFQLYGQGGELQLPVTFVTNNNSGTISGSFTANYTCSGDCNNHSSLSIQIYVQGSTIVAVADATPKYKVTSILYAAPGNRSANGFTNSTTNGTTTSTGSSFTSGTSTTFSTGFSLAGGGLTFGTSTTSGDTEAFTETFSSAAGVANDSNSANPNAINHNEDLFLIWLNPYVTATLSGPSSVAYSVNTQKGSNGQAENVDQVEVFASSMEANAQGVTTVPLAALTPQYDSATGAYDLPGLANVCAKPIYYPNQCTEANQCGCVPSDFTTILNEDPLLHYTTTESPLNADVSGVTVCSNPTSNNNCRYVPVPEALGSTVQATTLLSGPSQVGGNIPNNTYTQTDATQTTKSFNTMSSSTVSATWYVGPAFSRVADTVTFTWSDSQSVGTINGRSNQMSENLSSSTVGCYEQIPVFEDTIYHTFVFQQPTGNNSCP
jgi:hypothetical protein